MTDHNETWVPVKEYENLYEVSNFGRVRSLPRKWYNGVAYISNKGMVLSSRIGNSGYIDIRLAKNNVQKATGIHRLLAQAFIPNPENKEQVNHINGIKTDNRIENLEWVTRSENLKHAFNTGLHSYRGEKCIHSKLKIAEVFKIKTALKAKETQRAIAKKFGVTQPTVNAIKVGKTWKHINLSINNKELCQV